MRTSLTSLTTVLLLATGCGVTFDAEELCKTMPDQPFAALPAPINSPTVTLTRTLDYDLGPQLSQLSSPNVESSVRMTRMVLTAKSGISDFNFVDTATIRLENPAGGEEPADVLQYEKGGPPPGERMELKGEGFVDVTRYMHDGKLRIIGTLVGQLPQSFTADVQICVQATTTLKPF